jgi:hypothetical protein
MKRKLKDNQKAFIELLQNKYGPVVTRKQILETAIAENAVKIGDFLIRVKESRAKWGHYNLESILATSAAIGNVVATPPVPTTESVEGVPL